ncbi:MAG: ABC transporter permease [Chloroflexi bacterium]|nr:ABC transporter permease [Chloroflexota bacterium]
MAFERTEQVAGPITTARTQVGRWGIGALRFARRKPLGGVSAALLLVLILMAVFAEVIAPYGPTVRVTEKPFQPPGAENLLGTDQFGRDVFSRIVFGARISLRISLTAVALSTVIGVTVGLTSGYFGGNYDTVVQRFVDVLQAFPLIVMALAIIAVLGPSIPNVILAIGIAGSPGKARIMRSVALSLREVTYVEAARAMGASHQRILLRHILPNTFAPLIIAATGSLAGAILTEASLSFLGLGATEPTPAWGLMLAGSAPAYARLAPWVPVFPGLAITLAVMAFNLLGDAMRDTLDPRLRGL